MAFFEETKKGAIIGFLALEREVMRLRKTEAALRNSGAVRYKEGDRKHNVAALNKLWPVYADATALMDLLQRVYLAQVRYRITPMIEAKSKRGKAYDFCVSLDVSRTTMPRSAARKDWPKEGYSNKGMFTDVEAAANLGYIQAYCETLAQTQHKTVFLSVHNPELLAKLHDSLEPKYRLAQMTVNVRKRYTWQEYGAPLVLRNYMTVPASGVVEDALQNRANVYCDSIRLLGETADLFGEVWPRPTLNIVLCAMAELSHIVWMTDHFLGQVNTGIMREVTKYQGFRLGGNRRLVDKAVAMRYGEDVTVMMAVSPRREREIRTLHFLTVSKFVKVGALNVDTPALALRVTERLSDGVQDDPEYARRWEQGRQKVEQMIDPMVETLMKRRAVLK